LAARFSIARGLLAQAADPVPFGAKHERKLCLAWIALGTV
jgi:hypothetical protein